MPRRPSFRLIVALLLKASPIFLDFALAISWSSYASGYHTDKEGQPSVDMEIARFAYSKKKPKENT